MAVTKRTRALAMVRLLYRATRGACPPAVDSTRRSHGVAIEHCVEHWRVETGLPAVTLSLNGPPAAGREADAVSAGCWLVMECAAVSCGKAMSYLPVVNLLKGDFEITEQDSLQTISDKVKAKLLALDGALAPTLPALLALLDGPVNDPAWQSPQPRGIRPQIAHSHFGLGKLYQRTGNRERAREHLSISTSMYREMNMRFYLEQAEAATRS